MGTPPITEREASHLVLLNRDAAHVGWLLAADAPKNIAKGNRLYDALSSGEQTIAEQYRDHCLALYEGGNS